MDREESKMQNLRRVETGTSQPGD